MRKSLVLLAAVLLLAIAYVPADALVVQKTTTQLGQEAEVILFGKVASMNSRWDDGIINTYVTVRVREIMKGDPAMDDVIIRVPGGEVGNVGLYVSDTPWFESGEDVFVFLTGEIKGARSVVGWYQGKFTVKKGMVEELGVPIGEAWQYAKGVVTSQAKTGSLCYKLCGYTWLVNGSYVDGKYGPGNQGWSVNNSNIRGMTDAQVETALLAATGTWDAAGACWAFGDYAGAITHTSTTAAVKDGINLCTFGNTGSSVATTYCWYLISDKSSIIETDLVFNDVAWVYGYDACGSTTAFDLQEIATHEFGHWFCIADLYTPNDVNLTMYGYVNYGQCYKRTLDVCDIDAAKAIYGACAATPLVAENKTVGGQVNIGQVNYSVKEAGPVSVKIFDITGRVVKVLVNENQPAGAYTLRWDGSSEAGTKVAAGVYFYRVETPKASWSNKVILLK